MSAQELKREGDGSIRCPYCGSDALNPKLGQGDDVWVTLCESCGIREPMVWPEEIVKDPPAWTPLLFTCTRCPLSFPFMADLREHLKRDHLKWYD